MKHANDTNHAEVHFFIQVNLFIGAAILDIEVDWTNNFAESQQRLNFQRQNCDTSTTEAVIQEHFLNSTFLYFTDRYGNRIAPIKNVISSGKKPYLKWYPKNLTFLHITKLRKFFPCMHDQREEGYAVSSLRNRMIYSARNLSNSEFTQTFKTKKVFAEKYYWIFFPTRGAHSSLIKKPDFLFKKVKWAHLPRWPGFMRWWEI